MRDPPKAGRSNLLYSVTLALLLPSLSPSGVAIRTRDAVVWSRTQVVTGSVDTLSERSGTLFVNGNPVTIQVPAATDTFSVPVQLNPGLNRIVARVDSAGAARYSDTLRLTLGYSFAPEIDACAEVAGSSAKMHVSVIDNPDDPPLAFSWTPDPRNPAPLTMVNPRDSTASVSFPPDAPPGEYQFCLAVENGRGDTTIVRSLVRLDSLGLHAFDISADHACWIDSATVYGITPSIFVGSGRFADVTARIPEIAQLGVSAIWIQPVYATHGGGQGYDVIDYFGVRPDLGGESQLATLVSTAHAHGLRVLFDFVPNHTSLYHPYAQDAIQYGPGSHYYSCYQRIKDSAPYSSNENTRVAGLMTFVYYFWTDLVNLDYSNPEIQRMITEAGKYWIRKFDIDGYRVDASWGVSARSPAFFKQWRLALKRIKPDILLLAEDKASVRLLDANGRSSPFDHQFDAAYDWTNEMSWVSHWVWQSTYSASSNPTIFNSTAEAQRGLAMHNALTSNGAGYPPGAIVFRFLENNDTYRFLATHDLARTKMAAALEFSLHGIPLLYNGQEIGAPTHPYSTYQIFNPAGTIASQDQYGLYPYYQQLIRWRRVLPALRSANFAEVPVTPSASQYAFRRWSGSQNVFTCINMAASAATPTLSIPVSGIGLDSSRTYYLTDLMSGFSLSGTPASLASVSVPMPAYTTRILLLADTALSVTSIHTEPVAEVPATFRLDQNYPNPFNPATEIRYEVPTFGHVRLEVYDILGREVALLVNDRQGPGVYDARFDGSGLASGVYLYRLQSGGQSIVRKMLLVK